MRKAPALLLLATLSLAFAPAPLPRPVKKPKTDLEAMQGDWQMVTETIAGRKTTTPVTEFRAVVAGDRMTVSRGGKVASDWRVSLAPGAKGLDMRGAGPPSTGNMILAAYALEGDTLKLCFNLTGLLKRPADVRGAGADECAMVFRRVKR